MLALRLEQLAMHVDQPARAGALVQVVDILGDDQQLARPGGIELRQGDMRRIGRDAGKRLDHYLLEQLKDVSRSRLQAWIKEGRVLVNGTNIDELR
mgnify:CR=1 FL=1